MINADGNKGMERGVKSKLKEIWQEEFEDELEIASDGVQLFGELRLNEKYLLELVEKYLEVYDDLKKENRTTKVKIQCRKGEIRIIKL